MACCSNLFLLSLSVPCGFPVEEADIIDLEKRYWLLKAQSRTGRFDLETFIPLVSPPIHTSLSEGNGNWFILTLQPFQLGPPLLALSNANYGTQGTLAGLLVWYYV